MDVFNVTDNINRAKAVWFLFRPYKLPLMFLLLIMFLSGLLESLNLAALYPVINYGLDQNANGFIMAFFNRMIFLLGTKNLFVASCVLLVIITVCAVSVKAFNHFVTYRLLVKMISRYQKEIMERFIRADYAFFVKNHQGKLIHAGTAASKHSANMILYVMTTVNDALTLLLLFSLLVALTWQGTAIIVCVGMIYAFLVKSILHKIIYRSARIAVEAERRKNVILNEFITGIKTIKAFYAFDAWQEKYHDVVDTHAANKYRIMMGRVFPESLMKFIFFVLIAVIGMYISYRSGGDVLPYIPLFGTFALVASRIFPAVQKVGNDIMVLAACMPNTQIVYELLRNDTDNDREGAKKLQEFEREIKFKDVWFKHDGMEEYLLKGISFTIKKRKVTAIVGASGNGKTTLINLLLRQYSVERGSITLDGVIISEFSRESYLRSFGYVGQETFVYNDTIKENIRFGMPGCTDEMIVNAAKQANAHEFIVLTERGYDTPVGDGGVKLSGGQRQRIAIARALLRKPEIMVLDEATSSLDTVSERRIQGAINKISKQTTVLVIAHRLSTIEQADKICVVGGGVIAEEGTHEELLAKKNIYFNLNHAQLTETQKKESYSEASYLAGDMDAEAEQALK